MAEQDTNQPTAVLELTTVRQRQKIKIDDIQYEMLGLDEFELDSYLQVLPLVKKIQNLEGLDGSKLTTEEAKEIGGVVNQLAVLLLPDVPEKTFKNLTPLSKMAIVGAAVEGSPTDFFEKTVAQTRTKGRSSSRSSNGSTGARRRTGRK